jgi:glycosyl hydrolase family 100 (putative invertase)
LWAYKVLGSPRFDLLGNSLAILSGLVDVERARAIVAWVEEACARLRATGLLVGDLPPCLIPYIAPTERDWHPRYARFNRPGEYHNGGIWPFICGFYVAALVAAGLPALAAQKLAALTALVRPARNHPVAYGFNEWIHAQDGRPCGEDWQVWSAALYLYAHAAVVAGRAPFLPGPAPGG